MSVVTEEMHKAVLGAYMVRLNAEMHARSTSEMDIPSRDDIEFIISAAAPLIAARERELCLAIAQLEHSYAAEDIEIATNVGDETGRLQAEGAAHAANRICTAIRALD
jgi:hypothetical protein